MSLAAALGQATSEEDVKDAYIKALGLKKVRKNLIDLQTVEVWFEAKSHDRVTFEAMFTQLLYYVQAAINTGGEVPPLLAVIDTKKSALMDTKSVYSFLQQKTINWGKSASQYGPQALAAVSAHIGTHFVAFDVIKDEAVFIQAVKAAISTGKIIRSQITPDNLKQVFDKWVLMIGVEISELNPEDYVLLFYADIMNDGTAATHMNLAAALLFKNSDPVFELRGKLYKLASTVGYLQFWAMYDRPPPAEHRNYLLERRDSLIPIDERKFKGAYYTPLHVVDKAYDLLETTLGKKWQEKYLVWDMCCGVGNLEVKHSNHRNLFLSTLDEADINVMQATKTCAAGVLFQYDYLNDDIDDFGEIDYTITKKMPRELLQAITQRKKILVLINPPYAEAANADNVGEEDASENKKDIAATRVASCMTPQGYGSRELFTQFLVRIAKELPNATVAIFSKLKYVNSPNFESFREQWNAKYLGGFIIHSKAFDGLRGDFPIGFLIWATAQGARKKTPIVQIETEVLNKAGLSIGKKTFYNLPSERLLGNWIARPRPNDVDAIPLKNALTPATSIKDPRGTKWADLAIGGMMSKGSDMQNAATSTALFSSGYGSAGGFLVTETNIGQAAVTFAARTVMKKTWQNDRDQLLAPAKPLPLDFVQDCVVWMLFHGNNLSASADGLGYGGKLYSLVNHFIPFGESQVGASRFESDFMKRYLAKRKLTADAQAVLDAALPLWAAYFEEKPPKKIRDQYLLNRDDVGWYQIRNTLALRKSPPVELWETLNSAYSNLREKLAPQIFSFGMLKL